MAKIELLDSYEELVAYTAEIRETLEILHEWLSIAPKFEDRWSYYDLIVGHGQHFALLNLIMYRLDNLRDEHYTIIENYIKGV